MRIFIGEGDRHGIRLLYEVLVELLKKEGFAGATVTRGVTGFGGRSVHNSDKLLRLSRDLPIVVEVVDAKEKIDRVMPMIDEMMTGGLITLEKVTVIRYSSRHEK
jgi:PII-like signaling protein